jgi:hypothetical protein
MSTNQIKQNIIINSGKRIYKIICMIVIWEIYAPTLDNHVFMFYIQTQAFITFYICS